MVEEENTSEIDSPDIQPEQTPETETVENSSVNTAEIVSTTISQGGPYGEISLSLPGGWSYELCPMDSELYGMYGIKFYPTNCTN